MILLIILEYIGINYFSLSFLLFLKLLSCVCKCVGTEQISDMQASGASFTPACMFLANGSHMFKLFMMSYCISLGTLIQHLSPVHTINRFVPLCSNTWFQKFSSVHTSIGLNPLHITCWLGKLIGFPLPHIEIGYFIFFGVLHCSVSFSPQYNIITQREDRER